MSKGKGDGDGDREDGYTERVITLGAKNTASLSPGERIIVMTPGGGGWGLASEASKVTPRERDPRHNWRMGSVAARMEAQETA